MNILIETYKEEYIAFEKHFKTNYINTKLGKAELQKYFDVCNVKPRNIYTSKNDFYQRYIHESFIIYLSLIFFRKVYSFNIEEILNDIPEINNYYGWVKDIFKSNIITNSLDLQTEEYKEILVFWLGEYFKSVDKREYGEYYTPEELIGLSFKFLEVKLEDKVVDPSCGSGFFLQIYVEELKKRKKLKNIDDINILKENLFGYDIFPFPIIISKLLIGSSLYRSFGAVDNIFRFENIYVHNTVSSLTCRIDKSTANIYQNFDLIIGNPPFFRIEPNDENVICNCISYGHNYIHNVFLHWSIQHLNSNGKLCLFLPQSILSGYYYQKMRKEILSECSLDLIISDENHEKSFLVQQDIMVLYLSKSLLKKEYFQIGTPNSDFTNVESYDVPINITENKLKIIPVFKNLQQYTTLTRLSSNPIVEKLTDVKLATGNFVWNQNKGIVLKEFVKGAIPLISGPNITEERIKIGEDTKFSYCLPNKEKYIKKEDAILFRRMSPTDKKQRMVAQIMDTRDTPEYVLENHVNSIICNHWNPSELKELREFIVSEDFNVLMNAFCHTNQVSTNELRTIFETLVNMRGSFKLEKLHNN